MFPSNEAETIALFRLGQERLGWHIAHLQTAFPDAIIENEHGQKLIVEFEYEAKNFKNHGHLADGCDLILCFHNNWPDAPLPVWALKDCLHEEAEMIGDMIGGRLKGVDDAVHRLGQDVDHWQRQAQQAERRVEYLEEAGYSYDDREIDIEGTVREIVGAIPDDFPKWAIPPAITLLIFSCCLSAGLDNGYIFLTFFLLFVAYAAIILSVYLHGRQYGTDQ